MKTTTTKQSHASVGELREALETLYAELIAEFPKVQTSARKFQQAQAGTPAYDQAWAISMWLSTF